MHMLREVCLAGKICIFKAQSSDSAMQVCIHKPTRREICTEEQKFLCNNVRVFDLTASLEKLYVKER